MQKHTDPKGEGEEHVWVEEKESRKPKRFKRMYNVQKAEV